MVWKKTEDNPSYPEPAPAAPRPAASTPPAEPRRADRATATVGPSIFIKGDLSGDEDLVIEGRVEGKIDLKQHNVTIGNNGRVRADVFGNTVIVEGEVDGNLFAQQQAIVRQSGAVRGNITAPRVILEDGSRFRGSIDMEAKDAAKAAGGHHESAPRAGGLGAPSHSTGSTSLGSSASPATAFGSPSGGGTPAASTGGKAPSGQQQPAGAARGGAQGS